MSRAREQLGPGEARRPQVGQHERHRHLLRAQTAQDLERLPARAVADDLIVRRVATPQVLLDDGKRGGIVVHRHDHGLAVTHRKVISEGPADDIRAKSGARFEAAIEPRSPQRGGRSSVGRAPGCGPGGRGFESRRSPSTKPPLARGFRLDGSGAQTPGGYQLATNFSRRLAPRRRPGGQPSTS